ncbi:hypothetical protein, variant 1 [Batrachochytrium dendrobatidis JEL423]|nr:hypothetical protein O5D80_005295 [Batrachochytrium dendrobatidis]OAJ41197.1 hypothetical protein, variant 1 [Batrachochytrium dendrobatidis JEL423]
MHSTDTVKTRLQGQLTARSEKYQGMAQAYRTILKEEGVRGLYGGFTAAVIGSLLSHGVYFAAYEAIKRELISSGLNPEASYFIAGGLGDVAASVFYVPSEVLKTRLQLQGHYNNPHSLSAHNYRSTFHASTTILEKRGIAGMYHGWGATLIRDVPFTAIQFTLYETLKSFFVHTHCDDDPLKLTTWHDMASGGISGVVAGCVTTPLDVIKTYLMTQRRLPPRTTFIESTEPSSIPKSTDQLTHRLVSKLGSTSFVLPAKPTPNNAPTYAGVISAGRGIYGRAGISGLFSGVGPRMLWTGMQSTAMFMLYELMLGFYRQLE